MHLVRPLFLILPLLIKPNQRREQIAYERRLNWVQCRAYVRVLAWSPSGRHETSRLVQLDASALSVFAAGIMFDTGCPEVKFVFGEANPTQVRLSDGDGKYVVIMIMWLFHGDYVVNIW